MIEGIVVQRKVSGTSFWSDVWEFAKTKREAFDWIDQNSYLYGNNFKFRVIERTITETILERD